MGRTAPPGDWAVPSPSANRALFGVAIGLALLATVGYVLSPGFALGPFPMRRATGAAIRRKTDGQRPNRSER